MPYIFADFNPTVIYFTFSSINISRLISCFCTTLTSIYNWAIRISLTGLTYNSSHVLQRFL
jgi:hypothetical protein